MGIAKVTYQNGNTYARTYQNHVVASVMEQDRAHQKGTELDSIIWIPRQPATSLQ